MGKQWLTLFSRAPKSLQMVTAAMKLKDAYSLEGKLWPTYIAYSKQRYYFANKDQPSQGYGFSKMWSCMDVRIGLWRKLSAEELMLLKCGVGGDSWTARSSNQSIRKEISPRCSLEGLMLQLKLIFCPRDAKSWLIGKDPDAGRDWRQEEKGMTAD